MPIRRVPLDKLPASLLAWLRGVFGRANAFVSEKQSNVPTTHEPFLDHSLIEWLQRDPPPPPATTAGWSVYLQTHFLGGRAMFRNWEVADIGLLVQLRERGKLKRVKVGLLQSKRLYPDELKTLPDFATRYREGFFSLMPTDEQHEALRQARRFHFRKDSVYRALDIHGEQDRLIADYERQKKVPVYCLFYNPYRLPWTAAVPGVRKPLLDRKPTVGLRIVPTSVLRRQLPSGSPSYEQVARVHPAGGLRLESFVVDHLIKCRAGHVVDQMNDKSLISLFFERSGPIAAAISITIDAPEDVELLLPEPQEQAPGD